MKSIQVRINSFHLSRILFAALAVSGVIGLPATAFAQTSFIRVHQTGYVSTSPKRAYLMTSSASTGASFTVLNSSGSPVYSAALGADQGKWGTFAHVFALDFDSVATAGAMDPTASSSLLSHGSWRARLPAPPNANIRERHLAAAL